MLGVKTYSREYINSCREKVQEDSKAFNQLSSPAKAFENVFFNNMIIVLEQMFVHLLRGIEGKDGNPLNEVRMIADSILTNNGKLITDNTIKYGDAKAILKIKPGQKICLSRQQFADLSKAFFEEIERKFS